ncbi:phage tail tape measure protein [Deinococcus peraridilitoris]|uniref:NlpC/P60 family protein n=1 Tax=Deinococcus peraridilitoris (strain DSM 19664 / LMG 22246 / CIP 109416 / KR-200) TaxID=937777 RepID=K9ZZN6_DEIPD|nr:phage tail tape measure protein [Deinococcus peraridilitoris]AFZ67066.1 NlpC/P60 family protein [Deinococcus peraridilitoris DSM 19664]
MLGKLGDLIAETGADKTGLMRDVAAIQKELDAQKLTLRVGSDGLASIKDARVETGKLAQETRDSLRQQGLEGRKLDAQTRQALKEQGLGAKALRAEYDATTGSLRAGTAELQRQAAAVKLNGATAIAETQKQVAAVRLRTAEERLSAQQSAQQYQLRSRQAREATAALANEAAAYRSLWQSGVLNGPQVVKLQEDVRRRALESAAALDHTSDAYKRFTQVARVAQTNADSAMGINTPGGFSDGIHRGALSALGSLGMFGQLAEQLGVLWLEFRAQSKEARQAGQEVGQAAGQGQLAGLRSQMDDIRAEARRMGGSIEDAIRERLQIKSPSQVMYRVGEFAASGYVKGILSQTNEARRAGQFLADAARDGANRPMHGPGTSTQSVAGLAGGVLAGGAIEGLSESLEKVTGQLGKALPQAAQQGVGAAAATEVAAEGLGGAAEGAAGHVQSLIEAHKEHDPVARQAALGQAKLAIGFAASAAVIGGVALALGSLARIGIEQHKVMQKSFSSLANSGVTDLTMIENRIDQLKNSGNDAARTFSKSGLAAALADTVKAGASASEAMNVLGVSTKFAFVEGTNLTEQSGMLLKAINQYHLETEQAARVGDMFAKAGGLAAGSATDLFTGFNKVAGMAFQAKIEMSDLLGMLVELDNKGMSAADTGADGLNSALAALSDITPKATKQLQAWNIAVIDSNGNIRPAGDIIKDLSAKLSSLGITYNETTGKLEGTGEALAAVNNIMDTQGARAVLNLSGEWRTLGHEIENSSGALNRYSAQFSDDLEAQQATLKANIEDLGALMTKNFVGPLNNALEKLNAFLSRLSGGLPEFGEWLNKNEIDGTKLDNDVFQHLGKLVERREHLQNRIEYFRNNPIIGGLFAHGSENPARMAEEVKQLDEQIKHLQTTIQRGGSINLSGYAPGKAAAAQEGASKLVLDTSFKALTSKATTAIVDECAKWVRQTLGLAYKGSEKAIDEMFRKKPDMVNGKLMPTARSAADNFKEAGLLKPYRGKEELKEGDLVFYTSNGQNHVGIYVGNGYVRGNNRVTNAKTGGRDARGDVAIGALGNPTSYVRQGDYAAHLNLKFPSATPTSKYTPDKTGAPSAADANARTTALAKLEQQLRALIKAEQTLSGAALTKNLGQQRALITQFEKQGGDVKRLRENLSDYEKGLKSAGTAAEVFRSRFEDLSLSAKAGDITQGQYLTGLQKLQRELDAARKKTALSADATRDLTRVYTQVKDAQQGLLPTGADGLSNRLKDLQRNFNAGRLGDVDGQGRQAYAGGLSKLLTEAQAAYAATGNKGSQSAKDLLDVIINLQGAQKSLNKENKEYVLTTADWNKQRARATDLAQRSLKIEERGTEAQKLTLRGEIERYVKTNDAQRAAFDFARDLARKTEQLQDQADQRDVNRANLQKQLNRELAQGRLSDAQATLRQLEAAREASLAGEKKNAAQRLIIERESSQAILNARLSIAARTRDAAIKAARDEANARRTEQNKLYDGKTPQSILKGIQQVEDAAVATARTTYTTETRIARDEATKRVIIAKEAAREETDQRSRGIEEAIQKYARLRRAIDELAQAGEFSGDKKAALLEQLQSLRRELSGKGLDTAPAVAAVDKLTGAFFHHGERASELAAQEKGVADAFEYLAKNVGAADDHLNRRPIMDSVKVTLDDLNRLLPDAAMNFDAVSAVIDELGSKSGLAADELARLKTEALGMAEEGANSVIRGLAGTLTDQVAQLADLTESGAFQQLSVQSRSKLRAYLDDLRTQLQQAYANLPNPYADGGPLAITRPGERDAGRASVDALVKVQAAQEALARLGTASEDEIGGIIATVTNLMADENTWAGLSDRLKKALTDGLADAEERYGQFAERLKNTSLDARAAGFVPGQDSQRKPEPGAGIAGAFEAGLRVDLGGMTEEELRAYSERMQDLADRTRNLAGAEQIAQKATERLAEAQRQLDERLAVRLGLVNLQQQTLEQQHSAGLLSERAYLDQRETLALEAERLRFQGEEQQLERDHASQARRELALSQHQANLSGITRSGNTDRERLAQQHAATMQDLLRAAEEQDLESRRSAGQLSERQYLVERERLQLQAAAATRDRELQAAQSNTQLRVEAEQRYQNEVKRITSQGLTARTELERKHQQTLASLNRERRSDALEARFRQHLISERDYQAQREALALESARAEYEAAVQGGTDELEAREKFENERLRITQEGIEARQALYLNEFDRIIQGFTAVANVLDKITGGSLSKLAGAASSSFDAFKSFASGDIVGGITSTLNAVEQLGDFITDSLNPGLREYQERMRSIASDQRSAAGLSGGAFENPFKKALEAEAAKRDTLANAGFWQRLGWQAFGGAPQVLSEEAAKLQIKAAEIFANLGTTISNTLDSALMDGFLTGDFSKAEAAFDKSINTFIAKLLIQTMITQSKLAAEMKRFSEWLAHAMQDGVLDASERANVKAWGRYFKSQGRVISDASKEVLSELDGFGSEVQQQLYDVQGEVSGALQSSITNAFETGDWSAATDTFKKSINTLVAKVITETVVAQSKLAARLEDFKHWYASAMRDGVLDEAEQRQMEGWGDHFQDLGEQALKDARLAVGQLEGAKRTWQTKAGEIFNDLSGSIKNSLESALVDGFFKADFSEVGVAFEKTLNSFLAKMAIQALLAQSQIQELMDGYAQNYAYAMRDGLIDAQEQTNLDAWVDAIRSEGKRVLNLGGGLLSGLPGYGSEKQETAGADSIAYWREQASQAQGRFEKATSDAERDRARRDLQDAQDRIKRLEGEERDSPTPTDLFGAMPDLGISAIDSSLLRGFDAFGSEYVPKVIRSAELMERAAEYLSGGIRVAVPDAPGRGVSMMTSIDASGMRFERGSELIEQAARYLADSLRGGLHVILSDGEGERRYDARPALSDVYRG